MKREDAIEINGQVESMIHLANSILYIVNNSGDEEERKRVQKALGKAVTELDFEILEPLYKQYPDLRPKELDGQSGL